MQLHSLCPAHHSWRKWLRGVPEWDFLRCDRRGGSPGGIGDTDHCNLPLLHGGVLEEEQGCRGDRVSEGGGGRVGRGGAGGLIKIGIHLAAVVRSELITSGV